MFTKIRGRFVGLAAALLTASLCIPAASQASPIPLGPVDLSTLGPEISSDPASTVILGDVISGVIPEVGSYFEIDVQSVVSGTRGVTAGFQMFDHEPGVGLVMDIVFDNDSRFQIAFARYNPTDVVVEAIDAAGNVVGSTTRTLSMDYSRDVVVEVSSRGRFSDGTTSVRYDIPGNGGLGSDDLSEIYKLSRGLMDASSIIKSVRFRTVAKPDTGASLPLFPGVALQSLVLSTVIAPVPVPAGGAMLVAAVGLLAARARRSSARV